jgi:hypothetical protein
MHEDDVDRPVGTGGQRGQAGPGTGTLSPDPWHLPLWARGMIEEQATWHRITALW